MAVLKRKLAPDAMVKEYFHIKEDIGAISKYADSNIKEVREVAMKGLADIKASLPKFQKDIEKTRIKVEADLDSYEDALAGRFDERAFQIAVDAYEQDIVMMDFLEEDAKGLYALVEDCEKLIAGEKVAERKTDENEPKNYAEYVAYTKEAIAVAKQKRDAQESLKEGVSGETLSNIGMVSSAVVAASNPVLGSTLMVANLVAKRHRKQQDSQQEQNQPGNGN